MDYDPDVRECEIIASMAHTLVDLHSPLDRSWASEWECRADLLDTGYGSAAIDRHLDAARERAKALQ